MPVLRVHSAIDEIPAEQWDALGGIEASPFLEHRWLQLLESSGSAAPDTGWVPRHLTVWEGETLVAACPVYVKLHSMGEFVYDWSWAHLARRLGVDYYPKLVVGVPFTPATGPRLLVRQGQDRAARVALLVGGLHELARQLDLSGVHVLFDTAEEATALEDLGAATRLQFQFHWRNRDYSDFEDFLKQGLKSKRRTEVRRERRRLSESGVRVVSLRGEEIQDQHVAAMHGFYQRTCWQFGGNTYLNEAVWSQVREVFGERMHLVLAYDGERPIAGAFNVEKGDRLYGRYWGCSEERRYLHFEVCYYQAIEHCVARGLTVFEPGHGGGHKYPRGFAPQICHSSHWLRDGRLDGLLRDHLEGEREDVRSRVRALTERLEG